MVWFSRGSNKCQHESLYLSHKVLVATYSQVKYIEDVHFENLMVDLLFGMSTEMISKNGVL